MIAELSGKYLPLDRRDIQQMHVDDAQGNFFATCVKLRLFSFAAVNHEAMNAFSIKLFKLVKRRHTHLWDRLPKI